MAFQCRARKTPLCVSRIWAYLYEFRWVANLTKRFGVVDLEAPFRTRRLLIILTCFMRALLPYIGGKNRIANQIIELIPQHTTYVEPFAGGAKLLFRKAPSKCEVLNDIDNDVVNLYRVVQHHHRELLRTLRYTLISREYFKQWKNTDPANITDVQRAARYLYLLKNAFAGLVRNPTYRINVVQPPGFNLTEFSELIEAAHQRLARVQIECLPYQEILKRFDRPGTVFYCDPPYYGLRQYRYNLSNDDFAKLEERLRNLQGKFILSLNDVPEVRKLFSKFKIREIDLHYTAQRKAGKRFRELLITNFTPRKAA